MTPDGLFRKIAELSLAECEMNYKELLETVEQRVAEAIAAGREACAKVLETEADEIEAMPYYLKYKVEDDIPYLRKLANRIRARSEGGEG